MIKGISQSILEKNIYNHYNLFKTLCTYSYRVKTTPDPLPFESRFKIKDGTYLLPRPPLKPLTAYNVFTLMYMKIIRENYPNEPTSVILKKLSSLWNDDEFMIDHKLEVLNLSKFQNDLYYKEMLHYKNTYLRPKEPLSPYQIYLKEQYVNIQEQLKTNDISTITQYITADWHKLPEEKQNNYKQIFRDKFSAYKESAVVYDNVFRIPFRKYKNIYNLYLIEHYKNNKVKFKNPDDHVAYNRDLQNTFNSLNADEKMPYEAQKLEQDAQMNESIEKFKKFFDISEHDYLDICKMAKAQQKSKDPNAANTNMDD